MIATTTLKPARRNPGQGAREGYVSRQAGPAPRQRESSAEFFQRLQTALKGLERIEQQLPRDAWARFVAAYSQHWLYSVNHGEIASGPRDFYNEWAEVEAKGAIPMADTSEFHSVRSYGVYESPREKARRALGLED